MAIVPTQFSVNPSLVVGNGSPINGCIPLNQPIGFQANGMYMDNQSIYAGMIPYVDKFKPGFKVGQVVPTVGGTVIGAYQPVQNQWGTLDGNMNLNTVGNGTANGTITLSRTKLQIIYGLFGLNYSSLSTPYTGGVPQTGFPSLGMPFNAPGMTQTQLQQQAPCVSGIAISLSHYGTTLYGGRVYLYLNGSQHGDYLQF